MDIEYWWKNADWGQRGTLRKHTARRYFVQHKPHTDYHRIEAAGVDGLELFSLKS
jgi:hypothetical protein